MARIAKVSGDGGWKVSWVQTTLRRTTSRSKVIHVEDEARKFKDLVESHGESYPPPTALRAQGIEHLAYDINASYLLELYDCVHDEKLTNAQKIELLKITFQDF